MGIVRNPLRSLARVTCTKEGICDGIALAQISVVRTAGPRVRVARAGKRIDSERYERDEMTRRCKTIEVSQPPLQVDIMNAATVQAFWPRLLNV